MNKLRPFLYGLLVLTCLSAPTNAELFLNEMVGFGVGDSAYSADAVTFDGSNDYAERGGDLTGIANGKQGTVSFWFQMNGGNGSQQWVLRNNSARFRIQRTSGNVFNIAGTDGSTERLQVASTSQFTTAVNTGWHHLIASWDLAAGKVQLYVDDASNASVVTNSNGNVGYSDTNWSIGAANGGGNKFNGNLFDLWFNTSFIDLSVEANRRKFIDAAGKPVDLGADGSTPTGSQPLALFHLDESEAANNFVINAGSGGGFTLTGTLTTATTSPTD